MTKFTATPLHHEAALAEIAEFYGIDACVSCDLEELDGAIRPFTNMVRLVWNDVDGTLTIVAADDGCVNNGNNLVQVWYGVTGFTWGEY